ncbi:MAG: glycosyltransferase [Kineosporiaceae bacterium]
MLSVLHVIARMPPSGTELQLAGMLRAAQGELWEPTLCVLYPGFPLTAELAADGIRVVELDGRNPLKVDRFTQLRRLVSSGRWDVMHSSLWGGSAFARAASIAAGDIAVVMSERRVEEFRRRPQRVLDAALRARTQEYIGNSAAVVDFIAEFHGAPRERIHLIRNGIDPEVFRPLQPRPPLVGADGVRRSVVIGGLGRLVHQKGFDVLLRALPAVLAVHDVEVVIAGEGELRAELEAAAAGLPVRLPGAVKGARAVADHLRGLDLFVMPSRYEGLPNALLEAQACGVPAVACAGAGIAEAVGPDVPLVPVEDPAALAAALIAAIDDLQAASPRTPPPVQSFRDVAAAHLAVFESAVVRRRGRLPSTAVPAPS